MNYLASVIQVVPGDDFTVYAYFSDGTVRLADIKPLIEKGGVFAKLSDPIFFREHLTVMNDAVAWDVSGSRDPYSCIDLDPCEMYDSAIPVADPLEC